MKTISAKKLKELGAPKDLTDTDVAITRELCIKHASVFARTWASRNLLSPTAQKAYAEARAPARKAYAEADAPARKAYDEACAVAFFDAWEADQKEHKDVESK